MAKSKIFEDDLKQLIAGQKVVVVVGSGVSIATTKGVAPSWPALISAAAEQCAGLGVTDTWLKRVRSNLETPVELDLLLNQGLAKQRVRDNWHGSWQVAQSPRKTSGCLKR